MQVIVRSSEWSDSCSVSGRLPLPSAVGPLADRQRVVDHDPAGVGHPGRLDHQRARLVAAADRDDDAARASLKWPAPRSSSAAKALGESKRGRQSHSTEPVEGDQGAGVAVGEEAVAADRREAVVVRRSRRGQATTAAGTVAGKRRYADSRDAPVAHVAGVFVPLEVVADHRRRGPLREARDRPSRWDGRPVPLWRQVCFGSGLL